MTLAPSAFAWVRDLVRRESAIVLGPGKEYLVEARLTPLARAHGDTDAAAFIARVRSEPSGSLAHHVVEALTTNETSWMRDTAPFTALRDEVIPSLLPARRSHRRLRIWCAASSSGQEPYSVAMTVADLPALTGWHVEILGTDLSGEMVRRCEAATYTQAEMNRGLPASALVRHFTREGLDWHVSSQLTAMTSFRELNLIKPFPALGTFDIVFLRNVLIYFDLPTKQDILRRVRQVMAPDGYLYLGSAEATVGIDAAWERVPMGATFAYRIRADAV